MLHKKTQKTGYSFTLYKVVLLYYYYTTKGHSSYINNLSDCGRIHLQHRIEDEEQCCLLIKDLQGQIQQAYTAEIQDKEVLHEDYIKRVLHLRKVTKTAYF